MMTTIGRAKSGPAGSVALAGVLRVTGILWAGRSWAPKTLEDLEYATFESLPFAPASTLVDGAAADAWAIAVGADLRPRGFAVACLLEPLDTEVDRTGCEFRVIDRW